MLGLFLCKIYFGLFGNVVELSWNYEGKWTGHAKERGIVGITIFDR